MHDRTTTARWKYALALLGMMVAVFAPVVAATSTTTGAKSTLTTGTDVSAVKPTIRPTAYQRNVAWWPFTSGPYYGDVDNGWARPNNMLVTPVGSFTTDRPLNIPAGLTKTLAGLNQGRSQYFLVQMRPEALNQPGWREALLSTGAEIVYQEPVNALILRMNRAAYDLVVNSPDIQYIGPYHSAYRLSPSIGTTPQLSAELAAATTFNLALQLFPGEPAAPVVSALSELGLAPVSVQEPQSGPAELRLEGVRADQIMRLAQLEPVAMVSETAQARLFGGRGSLYLQTQPGGGAIGDFTYWKVGLQGDGQIIQITDSGLSVDAGDHADTRTSSGWDSTTYPTTNVLPDHRKVKAYLNASTFGGAGNLLGCDTPPNGAFTHGQVVTAVALGGATRGYVPASTAPKPTDDTTVWNPNKTWVRDYAGLGFWTDALPVDGQFRESQDSAYDGIAKGAKVVFVDGSSSCPEIANPGISPGNIQQTIQDTWLTYRASIHSYSFGTDAGTGGPTYNASASGTDAAVGTYPANVVIWAAGNAGPVADGNGSSLAIGNVSNEASCKNCISAGASFAVSGAMWDFQSEGPGPSDRHVVFVLGEGYDNSCRSDDPTSEDQTGAAGCLDAGFQAGTSFAAPNLAGAAAVIREYFAEGFYPDGGNTNPTNDSDKVPWISSKLVRALMIAGAQGIGGVYGQYRYIPMHRMNHVWGWGQLFLSRALPVAQFSSKTVSGLIVHDRPGDISGDGTVDGVSSLSLAETIGTGTFSTSAEFQVLDTDEDLVVALTWDDPSNATGAVDNNLDLEVRDCGANDTCGDTDDTLWYGGAFSEDYNEDGTLTELDIDGDGSLSGWWHTISNRDVTDAGGTYTNYKENLDNHEGVFVAWRNSVQDLNQDGTADLRYLDDVNGDTGAGCTQEAPCPRVGKWQVTVRRSATGGGTTVLRYAVAIAGPVTAGSSVRFDTNPVTCNGDQALEVSETEDVTDGTCNSPASCPVGVINARTMVKVFNPSGVQVDQESGLAFVNDPPGTLRFVASSRIPVSSASLAAGATYNDGVLSAGDGYSLKAYYTDKKSGVDLVRVSEAVVDCQPAIDVFVIRQLGPDTPFLLAGGCDGDRYLDAGESFSLQVQFFNTDPFQLVNTVASLEAFDGDGTSTPSSYIVINEPTKPIGALYSENLQRTTFGFRVNGTPPNRLRETFRLCIKSDAAGQGIGSCTTFQFLMQANDEKHFYITDCPTGCSNVNFDRNNDEKIESLVADNPYFDVMNHVHKNLSEVVTYEDLTVAGTPCTGGGCGNPGFNGPWNFDTDNEGFRTGRDADSKKGSNQGTAPQPTNWGEDSNWNGSLDAALNEDPNNNGTLEQNWAIGGGCGWMTKGTGTTGGVWHTGTIGTWASAHRSTMCGGTAARENDSICEQYDTNIGSQGQNYWWESLRSPALRPVRYGTDPDGYAWKSRILDWAWNMQFDTADSEAHGTWEFDLDTADGQYTQLGDIFIQKNFGFESGLLTGGQLDLYGGGYAFTETCRNSAGCTTSDPSIPNYLAGYGDEIRGTKGQNRAGRRGCYFNDLNRIADAPVTAAQRRVKTALDMDDDCDNEYSLGANGCPGNCGVDDDGNGQIDDAGEICPCTKCSTGSPRANIYCGGDQNFCNPTGGTTYLCNDATNANGVPTPHGDDTCGDGSADEWVRADWSLSGTSVRQRRNTDTSMLNGVASAGRYSGDIYYNNLEDFYGTPGKTWQSEVGFIVQEPLGTTAAKFGYGAAVDDMVIEWQETHPIAQSLANACTTSEAYFAANGQCAMLTLGQIYNTASGDAEIPVTIVDPFPGTWPAGNLGECQVGGTNGVQITAYSGVDLTGEKYCLLPTSVGSTEYTGNIKSTTRINVIGDGYVYAAYDGVRAPAVSVRYIDMQDGVPAHNFGPGPDGQPGIAGFDDNGDGAIDNAIEQCSDATSFAAGRSPHRPGTPARYSDDRCGCVENPLLATVQNYFDVVDIIVSDVTVRDGVASVGQGDSDGYLDKKETVVVDVKIRNLSDFPVEDLELTLSTSSALIECMVDDRILINRIEPALDPGAEIDTAAGTDHFTFVVANGANRVNPGDDFTSEFTVSVRGLAKASLATSFRVDLPIDGTAVVQTFRLPHNLNAPSATQTTDWIEGFETYANDDALRCLPAAPATRCTTAPFIKRNTGDDTAELSGTHCQINNPGNPFGNNTDTDDYCTIGEGYSNTENHWHLHAPNPGSGTVCERTSAAGGCPDGGRGHTGDKSMGSGYYASYGFPLDNNWTMTWNRMHWVKTRDTYQLGVGKNVNGNAPVACDATPCNTTADQAPVLQAWMQMSQLDWRTFGDYPPWTFDSALTYVCVDQDWDGTGATHPNQDCDTKEDGDKTGREKWEPLHAYYSPESSFRLNNFINCMYDPSDDGNTELDFFSGSTAIGPSSTCYPEASDSCVGRTDNEDPGNPYFTLSLGYPCWPETGVEGLEGEAGTRGPGKWIKRLYSLKQWRGQKVLFRWHVSPGGLKGYQHCATGPGCVNLDDGWFIDDLRLYGRANAIALANDNSLTSVPGVCPGSPADTLAARVAAIPFPRNFVDSTPKPAVACSDTGVAYCDFNNDGTADAGSSTGQSDAPGRPFVLDARNSTAGACRGGALEYRYETSAGALVRDWLTDPVTYVNPEYTTTYNLKMRCSSDTGGSPTISEASVTINTCILRVRDLQVGKAGTTDADLAWTGVTPWDVSRGALSFLLGNGGSFADAVCLANDQTGGTTYNDATPASAGNGFWYLVRDNDGTWSEGYTCLGIVGNRDTTFPAICP